jgi:hypothetical protein
MKLLINGNEYDDAEKLARSVPVIHWMALEEQSGLNLDDLDEGRVNWRLYVAAVVFLIRRHHLKEHSLTFKTVANELVAEDVIVKPDPAPAVEGDTENEGEGVAAPPVGPTEEPGSEVA